MTATWISQCMHQQTVGWDIFFQQSIILGGIRRPPWSSGVHCFIKPGHDQAHAARRWRLGRGAPRTVPAKSKEMPQFLGQRNKRHVKDLLMDPAKRMPRAHYSGSKTWRSEWHCMMFPSWRKKRRRKKNGIVFRLFWDSGHSRLRGQTSHRRHVCDIPPQLNVNRDDVCSPQQLFPICRIFFKQTS